MVKLLIIDDDLPTCDLLKDFFSKRDYEVFIATGGDEGLSIVREKQPNIVLLDIMMPGRSGMHVLQEIKRIDDKIKVIMMTAVEDEKAVKLASKYGASEYIIKPFSLQALEKDVMPKIVKQLI